MSKQKIERADKYPNAEDKQQHFKDVVEKNISIIDRQFKKLSKIPRARTYIYTPEQVNKIIEHLSKEVVELENILNKRVTESKSFQI